MASPLGYLEVKGMHLPRNERELLYSLARDARIIVNIGIASLYGSCSMRCLRAGSRDAFLIGIDIQEQETLSGFWNTVQIIGDSAKVLKYIHCDVDLAFVDGDHSEDAVTKDIIGLFPLMERGGVMAFHDYGNHNLKELDGLRRAINKLLPNDEWQLAGDVGSIRYFKK
jgi:hypothetical protein